MTLWRVAVVCVAVGLLVGSTVSTAAPPRTISVAPTKAAEVLEQLWGVQVPPQSCLANPDAPKCPAVSRIVITVPREESDDEEWTGFVPLEDAAGAAATSSGGSGVSMLASMRVSSSAYLATHGIGPGFACATIGHQPRNVIYQSSQGVNYTVHGKSENSCKFGVGVTYMENHFIASTEAFRWHVAEHGI